MVGGLSYILAFLASIHFCVCHESSGLTFELPDNEKLCFHEDFEGSRKYIFDFTVLQGGNNDVDATVESPTGAVLYRAVKRSKDRFEFDISWGTYTFCFSNEFSSITHKIVYFELRPEDHVPLAVEGGKRSPTANTQLEESMETIHRYSTDVMAFQKAYRLNEAIGRYQADQLNQTVQWWSLVQSVVILVAGLGEIFVLKRFFTDRKEELVPSSLSGLKHSEIVHAPPVMRP